MRIGVPKAAVAVEEKKALGRLAKRARVKGFRKGRLPSALVRSRYGPLAREDAREAVAQNAYELAVREQGLVPISRAELSKVEEEAECLNFILEFDVSPEVRVGRSGGFVVEKPAVKVRDEDVEHFIQRLRESAGSPAEPRDPAAGSGADEAHGSGGAELTEEEFLAAAGAADLRELRELVRKDLENRARERAEEEVHRRLRQALIDANPVDPPRSMVEDVLREMLARTGGSEHREKLVEMMRPSAENHVRGELLFAELAMAEGLEADEAEIRDIVNGRADAAGVNRNDALERTRRSGGLEYLRRRLMERNVLNHIRDRSEIIDTRTPAE